jgi:hypothetical protein
MEKLPMFALSLLGAVMAVIGQRNLSAFHSVEKLPLASRIANAMVAYVRYVGKLFVPTKLAALYPIEWIPATTAIGAAILLLAVTAAAMRFRTAAPYFLVGWLWYLGTLVPVIGIVQIGSQAIADRYTYFSYIGLFIAIVWGAVDIARRARMPQPVLVVVAVAIIALFAATAARQVSYWKDSETLFTRTIDVTPPNALAEYSLGQTLEMTKPDQALPHLRRSIELVERAGGGVPKSQAQAHVGVGTALLMQARAASSGSEQERLVRESIVQNQRALSIDPNAPHAKNNIVLAERWLKKK